MRRTPATLYPYLLLLLRSNPMRNLLNFLSVKCILGSTNVDLEPTPQSMGGEKIMTLRVQ